MLPVLDIVPKRPDDKKQELLGMDASREGNALILFNTPLDPLQPLKET